MAGPWPHAKGATVVTRVASRFSSPRRLALRRAAAGDAADWGRLFDGGPAAPVKDKRNSLFQLKATPYQLSCMRQEIWAWVSWAYMGLRCGMSLRSRHASPPRRPTETRCHVFRLKHLTSPPRPLPFVFLVFSFLPLTSHLPWHIKPVYIALYLRSCNLNASSAFYQVIK